MSFRIILSLFLSVAIPVFSVGQDWSVIAVNHTYEARIRLNGKVSTTQVQASDEADGVFEMGLRADVWKNVAQAALTQEIDIEFQRTAEPGDPDNLAARSRGIDGGRHTC